MTDSCATAGVDLHVEWGGFGLRAGPDERPAGSCPYGPAAPGTRLPSSRSLAVDLGVARNTIADARRALTAAPHEAFGYGDPRGRVELRTAVADYRARARGVRATPDRVVICSGFVHGLMLLAKVLRQRRVREVAVESYGLHFHRDLLTEAGLRTPALGFDGLGSRTGELGELRSAGAVLLTPAHQFPIGVALHPDRRAAAVDWARGTGGLTMEDDYDGEFRYDRQPVDPTPWQLEKSAGQRA